MLSYPEQLLFLLSVSPWNIIFISFVQGDWWFLVSNNAGSVMLMFIAFWNKTGMYEMPGLQCQCKEMVLKYCGLLYLVHTPVCAVWKFTVFNVFIPTQPHVPTVGDKEHCPHFADGKQSEVSSQRGSPRRTRQPQHTKALAAGISSLPSEVFVVA